MNRHQHKLGWKNVIVYLSINI